MPYHPGQIGQQKSTTGNIKYHIKTISLTSNRNNVWGEAYIPDSKGRHPLVIFSHELGTTHATGEEYAKYFASRGIAYYIFDFPGGSISGSKSDGKSTDMSVLTEASDLKHIVAESKRWDFVDPNRIYLHGGSQGGLVTAIVASQIPNDIAGLILAYPAFIIHDQLHHDFKTLADVPNQFMYIDWINVSKKYASDMWDYDVYGEIAKYRGPVLILHGNADYTVPMRYSQRAEKVYHNAQLKVISGGGHEFFGNAFRQATDNMLTFFRQQGALK
ncbi:alpha/beta hydrolase [Leuconostoc falkenbergense]|uniref:alpha/beta hydrolase family protein n=1 Tax=Leuconostoc falkenbergense TaxID=2766470 RepID=UPI0024AE2A90|nr:alpha/beta hydrolase [Leuconostoc falkenbergense]MDI6666707.1 alpha/beta hydrolase [Leuconostoc falkenbergense]